MQGSSRGQLFGAVLVVAALGCRSERVTKIRLEVIAEARWGLGAHEIEALGTTVETTPTARVRLFVRDETAGTVVPIKVWGKRGATRYAHGRTDVVPVLGSEVTATVVLSRLPCGAWCAPGATSCRGAGTVSCEERDDDQCLEWSDVTACPKDAPLCSLGVCGRDCVDECAGTQARCDGPRAVAVCGEADDGDSCRDWLPAIACAAGETCSGGACAKACRDECTPGDARCDGTGTTACGDLDRDGCTEWGPAVPCPTAAPPPSTCVDASTLRTYSTSACRAGVCEYPSRDVACPGCPDCVSPPRMATTDLVYFGVGAGISVSLSTGASFAPAAPWLSGTHYASSYRMGDVDGDGRADLVFLGGTNGDAKASLSTGAAFDVAVVWATGTFLRDEHEVADVDGDGRADLVRFGGSGGGVSVRLSTGSAFAAPVAWHAGDFIPLSFRVGDVDGDGRADLVRFGGAGGGVSVLASTGTAFADAVSWHAGTYHASEHRICDGDGDGRDDLVYLGAGGAGVHVSLSGGARFGDSALWHTGSYPPSTFKVGDVDADGRCDLINFRGPAGVEIQRSTGAAFADAVLWTSAISYADNHLVGDVDAAP